MGKKSTQKKQRSPKPEPIVALPAAPIASLVSDSPLASWIWVVAAVLAIWSFGYTTMRGSDLYWHLAAGDWMAKFGGFLYTDPWSFTREGQPWLNDAWLSDRIYHLWVRFFGIEALAWWKWGVLLATFLLLMNTLRRLTENWMASFIGAVLAIAVAEAFLDIRPHLYSLLGYSILLHGTVAREKPAPWLPLLFFIWVQMHAIFVFGLMALALLLAPDVLWGNPEQRRRSLILGIVSAVVCLVNPNFFTVFTRPLRYALDSSSPFRSIGEWQPPFVTGGIYSEVFPYAAGIFALAACVLLVRAWSSESSRRNQLIAFSIGLFVLLAIVLRRSVETQQITPASFGYDLTIKLSLALVLLMVLLKGFTKSPEISYTGLALSALTLAMCLRSRRFVPLFAISQALVLAPAVAPYCRSLELALRQILGGARAAVFVLPCVALLVGGYWLWPYPLQSYAYHYLMAEDTFPVDTVDFIQKNGISGKIFSYYNWGGYLHLRTQGALKVYIDGRADMVFDDETYTSYVRVLGLQSNWKDIIDGTGALYALWPKNEPRVMNEMLRSGDWRVLYEDAVSALLIRTQAPVPSSKPTDDTAWRQLGLGAIAATKGQLVEAEHHYRQALDKMPHLAMACYEVARVEALQGKVEASRKTVQHCQDVFPYPGKVEWFETYLSRLTAQNQR